VRIETDVTNIGLADWQEVADAILDGILERFPDAILTIQLK